MPRAGSEKLLLVTTVELGPESSGRIEFREGDNVAVRALPHFFSSTLSSQMSNINKPLVDTLSNKEARRSIWTDHTAPISQVLQSN